MCLLVLGGNPAAWRVSGGHGSIPQCPGEACRELNGSDNARSSCPFVKDKSFKSHRPIRIVPEAKKKAACRLPCFVFLSRSPLCKRERFRFLSYLKGQVLEGRHAPPLAGPGVPPALHLPFATSPCPVVPGDGSRGLVLDVTCRRVSITDHRLREKS